MRHKKASTVKRVIIIKGCRCDKPDDNFLGSKPQPTLSHKCRHVCLHVMALTGLGSHGEGSGWGA